MNRFEIIDDEAGHERLRKLLESEGLRRPARLPGVKGRWVRVKFVVVGETKCGKC